MRKVMPGLLSKISSCYVARVGQYVLEGLSEPCRVISLLKDGWFIRPDGVEAYAKVIGLEWIIKSLSVRQVR
jgi:hypothetical protein